MGGKTIRDERRAAITAVSADGERVDNANDNKKGWPSLLIYCSMALSSELSRGPPELVQHFRL